MNVVVFIITAVVVTIVVNFLQRLLMKIIGADVMFFDGAKKVIFILFITAIITGIFSGKVI